MELTTGKLPLSAARLGRYCGKTSNGRKSWHIQHSKRILPQRPPTRSTPHLSRTSRISSRPPLVGPEIAASVVNELEAQRSHLKLIASENYCSLNTQAAMGNLLTDKYAEGVPDHRYYGGCENIDDVEKVAAKEACALFGAEHAYVQPHSGCDANMVAYWAILSAKIEAPILEKIGETNLSHLSDEQWEEIRVKLGNQKLMGLDYYSGGHLTHGYRQNVSSRMFQAHSYTVDEKTGLLDYDDLEKKAIEVKPLILLAGYSAYPRAINFRRFREIADKVGAVSDGRHGALRRSRRGKGVYGRRRSRQMG